MAHGSSHEGQTVDPGLGFRGFVVLMAALMAINALGIDIMLAALHDIGRDLHVTSENDQQWVIAAYVLGFGAAQLVWGPLADRYGRKVILVAGVGLYGVLSLVGGLATTFPLLLAARALQGIAAAAPRVLAISIVRDCYEGRQMARIMSLATMCFLIVPILAPTIGQGIVLATGSWRWIFVVLAALAFVIAAAGGLRLRETLHPEFRRPASIGTVLATMRRVLSDRTALGYTICNSLMFGSLVSFISSAAQVFGDVFGAAEWFPLIFAGIAGSISVAAFFNSRIVERYGSRRVSHTAMFGFAGFSILHLALAASGHDTLATLSVLQAGTMFCFGLMGSNFSSMAMEPMGSIAGTASSVQGFLSTTIGGLIGIAISQSFDGTTVPLALGYTIIGVGTVSLVLVTERGRLFQAHNPRPAA